MKTGLVTYLCLLFACFVSADNKALVIGVNYYAEFEPVDGAMASVTRLKTFYEGSEQSGVDCKVMSDLEDGGDMFPIRSNIMKQIETFAAGCKKGDRGLLIHFGQTIVKNKKIYLIPTDGRMQKTPSLIAYNDLLKTLSNSDGEINFVTVSKSFSEKDQAACKSLTSNVSFSIVPFKTFSGSRLVEGLSGGADLYSQGNRDGRVSMQELSSYMSNGLKTKEHCHNGTGIVADKSLLMKNNYYSELSKMNSIRKKCITTIKDKGLLSEVSKLERRRVKAEKQLKQGVFLSAYKESIPLRDGYLNVLKESDCRAGLDNLIVDIDKVEKELLGQGATSLYPKRFTSFVILKDKAEELYNRGQYTKALTSYTQLHDKYLELSYTILNSIYLKQASPDTVEVLASFGGDQWNSITKEKKESEALLKDGQLKKAVELQKTVISSLPSAISEAADNLQKKVKRFSTPSDYKTGLVFISQLGNLTGYESIAESLKNDLMSNKRFGKGKTFSSKAGIELVYIPAGRFLMGSSSKESGREDDESQHEVQLQNGFFMGKFEVTEKQWLTVMGAGYQPPQGVDANDVEFVSTGHPTYPRNCVSWFEVATFCNILSKIDGVVYRLPTEAEWEYACRADSKSAYNTYLPKLNVGDANVYNDAAEHYGLKAVGSYDRPNKWGLYDMHGNVWEWCSDWKGTYKNGLQVDPKGEIVKGDEESTKIVRGGSWFDDANSARSANRWESSPKISSSYIGFRVVLEAASIK